MKKNNNFNKNGFIYVASRKGIKNLIVNYLQMSKSSNLTHEDSINLKRLMSNAEDYQDNTEHIRRVKHSFKILHDIRVIEQLKRANRDVYENDKTRFRDMAIEHAAFLFTNYTDIFNRLLKDELNLAIMIRVVKVLEMIEEGKVDQQEGSAIVGKLLHELYVDSNNRMTQHLEEADGNFDDSKQQKNQGQTVSYKQWKQMQK